MFERWTEAQAVARFGAMQSDWLEREYSPSSAINGNYQPYVTAYTQRSAAVRDALQSTSKLGIRYGKRPRNIIDVFPALTPSGEPAPTIVFFHGGYWQESSLRDVSFPAAALNAEGITYISVGYTLAPKVSLSEIVDESREAVAFIVANAASLAVNVGRLIIGGHSAGAHLAVMSGAHDGWNVVPRPGLVLLSGIYELFPLLRTSINRALELRATELDVLSPLRLAGQGLFSPLAPLPSPAASKAPSQTWAGDPAPLVGPTSSPRQSTLLTNRQAGSGAIVAWGENDTNEFAWQSTMLASALRYTEGVGKSTENQSNDSVLSANSISSFCVGNRNHFDLMFDLADRSSQLFQSIRSQLNLAGQQ